MIQELKELGSSYRPDEIKKVLLPKIKKQDCMIQKVYRPINVELFQIDNTSSG